MAVVIMGFKWKLPSRIKLIAAVVASGNSGLEMVIMGGSALPLYYTALTHPIVMLAKELLFYILMNVCRSRKFIHCGFATAGDAPWFLPVFCKN